MQGVKAKKNFNEKFSPFNFIEAVKKSLSSTLIHPRRVYGQPVLLIHTS